MAEITDRTAPADVPKSSDTLADIKDPDAVLPAEIRAFGKTLLTVAEPPEAGDTIVLLMRLRVYDVGTEYNENGEGEGTPYRKAKLVSCWKPGTKEPEKPKSKSDENAEKQAAAAENQPPLFDEDGTADPDADPDATPGVDEDGYDTDGYYHGSDADGPE